MESGSWQNSGTTVNNLAVGSHTVSYKPISGWSTPSNQNVNISASLTTTSSGTYTVNITSQISLSGNFAFGDVTINQTAQTSYTISNTGSSNLTVSSINYPSGFTGNWSSGIIIAGNSQTVTVTFAPTLIQGYSGVVAVNSNATSGTNTRAISGNGISSNLGSISGNIQNVEVNSANGSLEYSDFASIGVQLLQNGNLVASTNADGAGNFEFTNLSGSTYSIVAINTGLYTVQSRYDNVFVGSVVSNMKVPYELVGQIRELVTEVQTQEFDADVFLQLG